MITGFVGFDQDGTWAETLGDMHDIHGYHAAPAMDGHRADAQGRGVLHGHARESRLSGISDDHGGGGTPQGVRGTFDGANPLYPGTYSRIEHPFPGTIAGPGVPGNAIGFSTPSTYSSSGSTGHVPYDATISGRRGRSGGFKIAACLVGAIVLVAMTLLFALPTMRSLMGGNPDAGQVKEESVSGNGQDDHGDETGSAVDEGFSPDEPPAPDNDGERHEEPEIPGPEEVGASAPPSLADFNWLTPEIEAGAIPDGGQRIEGIDDASGRWKGYLFGGGMERFFMADISGSHMTATMNFQWIYVHDGSTGEGTDDDSPDSQFHGTMENGSFEAVGAGRVSLPMFWYSSGREFAAGTFMWPDGQTDTLLLVRP